MTSPASHRQHIPSRDPITAQAIVDVLTYFEAVEPRPRRVGIAGPALRSFVNEGRIALPTLRIIGRGHRMSQAEVRTRHLAAHGVEPALNAARDARRRFGVKTQILGAPTTTAHSPHTTRAIRIALARATPMELLYAPDDRTYTVNVVRPFDAYLLELATYLEAPRRSVARHEATKRALALAGDIGPEQMNAEFAALQAQCAEPRRVLRGMGLHKDDPARAHLWHSIFTMHLNRATRPTMRDRVQDRIDRVTEWLGDDDVWGSPDR